MILNQYFNILPQNKQKRGHSVFLLLREHTRFHPVVVMFGRKQTKQIKIKKTLKCDEGHGENCPTLFSRWPIRRQETVTEYFKGSSGQGERGLNGGDEDEGVTVALGGVISILSFMVQIFTRCDSDL